MFSCARLAMVIGLLLGSDILQLSQQGTYPEEPYYFAGVVEFRPTSSAVGDSAQQVRDNLASYVEIIGSEEAAPTDIIVFPESTLNSDAEATFVPDPYNESMNPCMNPTAPAKYHRLLIELSCAAGYAGKYVVINLTEKENCTENAANDPRPCAANGLNMYNTNVVFDRSGVVISRYRKVNLYGEPKNTTYEHGFGSFETDFDVRFGHFVCFDILFYEPAQQMVTEEGITDFLFPAMWFSQLPFLTGVQFQAAWSYANDVNLLAAGASRPAMGNTGSGIYAGKDGTLVSVMNQGEGQRRLYVAKVPKRTRPTKQRRSTSGCETDKVNSRRRRHISSQDIWLKRDYLELYESVVVDLQQGSQLQREVCHGTFCCQFELRWHSLDATDSQYYTYRLGAYAGWRKEAAADTNRLKNCALFSCIGADIMDCGKAFPADVGQPVLPQVAFDHVRIEANFSVNPHSLLMPNSLKDDLMPLALHEFDWSVQELGSVRRVRHTLNTTTSNLLTFATYGNYYDGIEDCQTPGDEGAGALVMASALLTLCSALLLSWLQ